MLGKHRIPVRTNGNHININPTYQATWKKRMFGKIIKLFGTNLEKIKLEEEIALSGKGVFAAYDGSPFRIIIGGKELHLYPEPCLDPEKTDSGDLLLIDPEKYFDKISGFKRVAVGDKLILGGTDPEQALFFNYSEKVAMRHCSIEFKGDGIIFKDLATNTGSRIAPLQGDAIKDKLISKRKAAIQKLRDMFGLPLQVLAAAEAFPLLNAVNSILSTEMYRRANKDGEPGALVEIPDDKKPIILGDIHTNLDNLITILSTNDFLDSLLNDKACLIILGDAPHCEFDGREGEMDSSLLIMDFIFKLKILLPHNFFYLRGNHDSFSPQIRKAGINQGALWKKKVVDSRGESYLDTMETFYKKLPMVAIGKDFITCHAGPTKSPISLDDLVNLKEDDHGYYELLWSRVKSARQPAGYVAATVKNFRRGLGFEDEVTLIVGHTPPTQDDTLWLHVGGINNHHVLFDSRLEGVPVFTRIGNTITPLMYKYEKLTPVLS